MSKCDDCDIKKWYAIKFNYHIFDERDCPYKCEKEEPKEDSKND